MEIKCEVLKSEVDIYYCHLIPKKPKAIMLLLHGYGNHYGYFQQFMEELYEEGYGAYAYDHRGHGRSIEERGYVAKFELMINDVETMINLIKFRHGDIPIYTYGHSMGGLISFLYGVENKDKIAGQIFESAALGAAIGAERIPESIYREFKQKDPKRKFYHIIKFRVSRSKEHIQEKRKDPYCLKYGTAGLAYEFICRGVKIAKDKFKDYELPCLIMHGEKDRLISYENSIKFYFKIKSKDKEIEILPLMNHELIFEPERVLIINRVLKWLNERNLSE